MSIYFLHFSTTEAEFDNRLPMLDPQDVDHLQPQYSISLEHELILQDKRNHNVISQQLEWYLTVDQRFNKHHSIYRTNYQEYCRKQQNDITFKRTISSVFNKFSCLLKKRSKDHMHEIKNYPLISPYEMRILLSMILDSPARMKCFVYLHPLSLLFFMQIQVQLKAKRKISFCFSFYDNSSISTFSLAIQISMIIILNN